MRTEKKETLNLRRSVFIFTSKHSVRPKTRRLRKRFFFFTHFIKFKLVPFWPRSCSIERSDSGKICEEDYPRKKKSFHAVFICQQTLRSLSTLPRLHWHPGVETGMWRTRGADGTRSGDGNVKNTSCGWTERSRVNVIIFHLPFTVEYDSTNQWLWKVEMQLVLKLTLQNMFCCCATCLISN